jgi:GNAT superfamily N-acetyltransferase
MTAVRDITAEQDVRDLFGLMQQLRPQLRSADAFVDYWKRQADSGYRLVAVYEGATAHALASYRRQENLVHGRFLYVEDLVTDAGARGRGHGERLMAWLHAQARSSGCARLVLDTGLDNVLAHRFYYRCGLLAGALRFNAPVTGA